MPGKDVAALEAKDVIRLMWEAGFTEDQILKVGTDLRNAIAQNGGAQIKVADKTEAIIAVDLPNLYVSTRHQGNFLYNLKTGNIRK